MSATIDPKVQQANDELIKAQAELRQKMQQAQIKVQPIGAIAEKQ